MVDKSRKPNDKDRKAPTPQAPTADSRQEGQSKTPAPEPHIPNLQFWKGRRSRWPKPLPYKLSWGMKAGAPESQRLPPTSGSRLSNPNLRAFGPYMGQDVLEDFTIDVSLQLYRHTTANPTPLTRRPWRDDLQKIYESLPSEAAKKDFVEFYTVGYLGDSLPPTAPRRYEQAFNFGLIERAWDIDIEHGLFRDQHGITEEGEVGGVRQFLKGMTYALLVN
ncbi:hypothetical protein DRE_00170 [Drechslerella stenobrocha 248]|uniref:Uncharacterized protein n=1 Tax=Drechslerella stenobrocha 248 TaxID=1043628 RepID=W7IHV3_9PEZI|nr:hypothetical protein DRE_00170 [Drechslerella stenobrocha 248]